MKLVYDAHMGILDIFDELVVTLFRPFDEWEWKWQPMDIATAYYTPNAQAQRGEILVQKYWNRLQSLTLEALKSLPTTPMVKLEKLPLEEQEALFYYIQQVRAKIEKQYANPFEEKKSLLNEYEAASICAVFLIS